MASITTVGQLRKALEQYDDALPVGGLGHFGELLEIDIEGVRDAYSSDWRKHLQGKDNKPFKALEIYMEDKGPDPD